MQQHKDLMRFWRSVDLEDIRKHLMIVGDALGSCEACKEIGFDYTKVKSCPACGVEFRYIASQHASGVGDGRFHAVKRFMSVRPDLSVIDYEDFKKELGRDKVKKIFND